MGFTVSREVVAAARSGDRAALDMLLTQLWPEAYRVALGVLRDRELAQDAAQDACAGIAASIAALREVTAFYTWFYDLPIDTAGNIGEERQHAERLDVLNALAALPLGLRVPIVLHYYAGLNSREIGAALGAPSATVRFRLALARRALRAKLEVPVAALSGASPDVC